MLGTFILLTKIRPLRSLIFGLLKIKEGNLRKSQKLSFQAPENPPVVWPWC